MWANLNLLHNDVTLEDSYTKRMNAPWTDLGGGCMVPVACPGIRKGGGGAKSERLFFFAFQFFKGEAQLRK